MHKALENLPGPEKWFHHGEEILFLIEQFKPRLTVELGTYKGASAIAIGRVVREWGGGVITFDITQKLITQAITNINEAGLSNIVVLHPNTDWQLGKIDCLYIDAEHTEDAVTKDLETWWPRLKHEGLLLGDDYDNPLYPGVTTAFDKWERLGHKLYRGKPNPNSDPPNMRLIWGVKDDK